MSGLTHSVFHFDKGEKKWETDETPGIDRKIKNNMAPPTPILTTEQILREKERVESLRERNRCQLRSLTQHLCHFEDTGEYVCLPFKRVFEQCLGRRLEVTDATTNDAKS